MYTEKEFILFKILLAIGFIWLCLKFYFKSSLKQKIPKKQLARYYGVDRATLNKWLRLFYFKSTKDFEAYLKKRKIDYVQYSQIKSILGDKSETCVMSKKEIVNSCNGSYRSLRESIQLYPNAFGISIKDFGTLSKFPPYIVKKIIAQYA